jgi:hypothetical protein
MSFNQLLAQTLQVTGRIVFNSENMLPNTCFVSKLYGSDTEGDGTSQNPFATIMKGVNSVTPTVDTTACIFVIDGAIYEEEVVIGDGYLLDAPGARISAPTPGGKALTIGSSRAVLEQLKAPGGWSIYGTSINGNRDQGPCVVEVKNILEGDVEQAGTGILNLYCTLMIGDGSPINLIAPAISGSIVVAGPSPQSGVASGRVWRPWFVDNYATWGSTPP